MVDRHALSARLDALEGYLTELESFRTLTAREFVSSPGRFHLAERLLHLACECVLDIAHHVIAEQGFRQATSYRDAMDVLAEEKLIAPDLAEKLKGWMGFRNILVHFYLGIDHSRTFVAIVNDLDDLRQFARAMAPLLEP